MPHFDTLVVQHASQQRRSLRERLLFAGPVLALALVLSMLWGIVAWFAFVYPKGLLAEQRRELAASTRAAAVQTEAVLGDAEASLRTIDLWLLTRGQREPLNDASLSQLAETLRDTSRNLVDVLLVAKNGEAFRIPTMSGQAHADVSRREFFELLRAPSSEGLMLGQPTQLRSGGPPQLPMAMRLSAPAGDLIMVLAVIDLQRLSALHKNFARGSDAAVTLMRSDGIGIVRTPDLPGFTGRDLFADRPGRRADFADREGFFTTDGAVTDRIRRLGAYETVGGFDLKLLVSQGESAALAGHLRQRRLVLLLSGVITALAMGVTLVIARMQRVARLREAALAATSDASPLGLFRCDAQGRTIYANETYLRQHGLTPETQGWGWLELLPAEQRDAVRAQWIEAVVKGQPVNVVRRMQGRDGEPRLMAVRTAPLLVGGRPAGQVGTVEDVTARDGLVKAQQTLAAIFDMTPDYVCQIDLAGRMHYVNPAARRRLGIGPDAPLDSIDYQRYYPHKRLQAFQNEVLPTAIRAGHWHGRSALLDPCGEEIPVDTTVLVHRSGGGQIETVSIIMRDISAELQAQRQRMRVEATLLAVAHTAPVMIAVIDTEQRYLFFNEAYAQRFGARREDWIGRHVRELIGPAEYARVAPIIDATLAGERRQVERTYESPDSLEPRIFEIQYAPLIPESGQIEGAISIGRDITDLKREERRLRQASQTDPLTQLLNRSGFSLGVDERLAQARQTNDLLGLLYLDLDRFKPVNDQHGHPVGDALLKAVAGRLRHALRPQDLVARLGGDEFAVLLSQLQDPGDAEAVAAKLVKTVAAPYRIDELQLEIGVSIGYCVAPGGMSDIDTLVAQADAKLYEAKRAGRGRYMGTVLVPH